MSVLATLGYQAVLLHLSTLLFLRRTVHSRPVCRSLFEARHPYLMWSLSCVCSFSRLG
jgi:hypothetical protein